ncbi:MAG: MaoC family dehydratase N-terminal domain-containing protein [Deltaproteobacteria bacterium]|nr:MaoC family dehydratase N-terminal domain-containing protein [Deltaproteobacteria bacterium]
MTIDLGTVGAESAPATQSYDWRDVALYAIGLGAGTTDLDYLLEDPPPKVLPTFGVIPTFGPVFDVLGTTGGNMVTLLHSAQRTELIRPFPASGTMRTLARIRGIWDMKIGALMIIDTETDVDGEPTARTSWQLLLRGEGGFGGERPPALLRVRPPRDAEPVFCVEVPTAQNQALLYRLNGDINPIHSRPEVAAEAGFERPILHGLCFYGIAGRVALRELAGDDPGRFRALEARFAKVVMPGDTLVVQGFALDEPGRAAVTVTVKESGDVAIANGVFEYES